MNKRVKKIIILSGLTLLLSGQIQAPSLAITGNAETQTENSASNPSDGQEKEETEKKEEVAEKSEPSRPSGLSQDQSDSQSGDPKSTVKPPLKPSLKTVPNPPSGIKLDDVFKPAMGSGVKYLSNSILQLSDSTQQVGSIWAKEKLDLKHPFSMTFYLYLGSQGKMAADGITFTLQTKGDSWLGNSGQSLGVYSGNDNPKQDLLSLEFDTFYNGDRADDNDFNYPIKGIKDLFNGHIAFRTSGSAKDPHYGIVDTIEKKDFSNGSWKKVNIDYTPNALGTGTIRYDYIDLGNGIKRNASLTFNYDGKGKVPAFKGTSEVFWGFTSATGELWAENAIAFDALPVQGKVEAKDSSIYVGQKWSPSDNFVSGKDTFGKPLDVKDLRIYVDGKLNGTLDTSKPGVHKFKYEYVVKTNGLPDQIFDKEVTVTVLQTTQVKSKPQVLRYIDNDSSKFNAKDFVTVADDKGKPLSNYTARFLSFPNSLNGKEAVVEVTDTHGQVFTVKVPVTYKLGNTINLLGRSDDRVATFSLDDAGKNIVATYNYASGNTKIHRDFSDIYYSFSHFWQKTLNSGSLNTQNPDYIFSAKGTDLLNTLDQFDGDRILGVSPGDVIKINHKEGGHLLQNYVNNASEGDSPAKEMLYEITTKGFKTLALNRLIPVDSVVLQGASKADLDKNLSTYLPVNGNVKMVGFKTYPDVNKRGNSTGVITVKEELSIGKSVTWDYAVKFNVQRKFDSVTAKKQVLKYTDNKNDYDPRKFVEVKDISGKVTNDYHATFTSFPNSLDGKEAIVEVTPKNDTIGEKYTVKVPVTYEFANSINLLGRSDDRVATFSLDKTGKNIVATYNYASGDTKIHRDFSDTYYSFAHFWQDAITAGSLDSQKPNYKFTAKGTDLLNILDGFGSSRELGVSPGDVIKINHKEGGHLLQNYVNNVSEGNSPSKEMVYEVTTNGFKTLALNRLTPVNSVVLQGTSQADLDKKLSNYLPVSGNVKLVGFKTYPDVSKRGSSNGVITVKETLSNGKIATWDYTVKFEVQRKLDTVTAKKQVLKYTDSQKEHDPKKFVEVKDASGKVTNDYNASFTSFPNSLNGKQATVEVTPKNDTLGEKYTVNVPVTYEFGNSINLLGRSDDRVATFSLDDAGENIVATYDYDNGKTQIHRDFSDTYYSFTHFWQRTIASGALNTQTPNYVFSAKGTDLLNTLDQFGKNRVQGVSPGDVIKIDHAESGERFQNYVNNVSEGNSLAKEMVYEVTTKGFKALTLNHLMSVDSVILQGTSKTELDKNLSNYLPVSGDVKIVGFKTYPDVSKRGSTTGVITVKEMLSNGKSATWDYTVKFDVQRKFDSVTAKKQVLKFGNRQSDYDPKKFVEVKDASGKVTNDYTATFVSFPDSLNGKEATVEVIPKNDTLGEKYTIDVPVTYELGNSINLLGYNDDRVATFSLNDGATKVTATYNHAKGKTAIHRSFSDTYYSFEHFWQKTITSGALNTQIPDYAFSAKGIELLSKLDRFGGYRSLDVSSGDVIKIKHKEPGRRFQNYMNSVSQGATSRNEVYFEIARDGYRELNLNKLSSKVVKVKWQATTVEMDEVLQQLVDISTYPNLKIVGYTQYPDTSKTGKQAGKIKVEETLISGKKASYTYDITLDAQPFDNTDPDSHDPKDPNMWLNVEVPLEMDFHSTENSKHQKIEGSVGKVKNHSGRPVQVTVKGFTNASGGNADTLGVASLILNGDALPTPIDLKHFSTTPQHLIDLQSPAKSGQNVNLSGVSEINLSISGTVVSDLKTQHHSTNKFELLFTPLDKDGQPNL